MSEGATTELTDSDTRTQRERNTHRTHTRGCVWECQRPDVRGQIIPGQRADSWDRCQRAVAGTGTHSGSHRQNRQHSRGMEISSTLSLSLSLFLRLLSDCQFLLLFYPSGPVSVTKFDENLPLRPIFMSVLKSFVGL